MLKWKKKEDRKIQNKKSCWLDLTPILKLLYYELKKTPPLVQEKMKALQFFYNVMIRVNM